MNTDHSGCRMYETGMRLQCGYLKVSDLKAVKLWSAKTARPQSVFEVTIRFWKQDEQHQVAACCGWRARAKAMEKSLNEVCAKYLAENPNVL